MCPKNSHQHQIYGEKDFENQPVDPLVKNLFEQESGQQNCVLQGFRPLVVVSCEEMDFSEI